MTRFLTLEEVIAINFVLINRYSPAEHRGVKEPFLLDSALSRPMQSVFGKEAHPDIHSKAAALFDSIAKNHCFYNANKRTALVSLRQFLAYNGFEITMEQNAASDFVVDTVLNKYTFEEIVEIIRSHSTKRK